MVQVSIIHLTVETGNKLENLMKEVVFGWWGAASEDQLGFDKKFTKEVESLEFNYVRSDRD